MITPMQNLRDLRQALTLTVLVAGLGYFVDLFDITLFGVVRGTSLADLGLSGPALFENGVLIYNAQMIGLMLGGLLWGTLADKRGRLSVMMASILLYSVANIANAFVWNVPTYVACRFFGGLGLAGELGAAITLVAESLPREKRGFGTTLVAMLGMLGIVGAAIVGQLIPWRWAYAFGGLLGFGLLFARVRIHESTLFTRAGAARGNLALFFTRARLKKYFSCLLIGVPVYFTTGVLFIFAPEVTQNAAGHSTVSAGNALLVGSIGLSLGDLFSGLLSQKLRSRKRALRFMLTVGLVLMWTYFAVGYFASVNGATIPAAVPYALTFLIGLCVGYWAVLITSSAEQFGTNIRATAATTIPNFVRGSAIFAVSGVLVLQKTLHSFGITPETHAAPFLIGTLCFGLALFAIRGIDETFGRDLDFVDHQ